MNGNVGNSIDNVDEMTVGQLRDKYAEVFGEPTRSGNKQHLIKRIAWRIQALAEGDLSERARHRALEIANDAYLRVHAPRHGAVIGTIAGDPPGRAVSVAAPAADNGVPMMPAESESQISSHCGLVHASRLLVERAGVGGKKLAGSSALACPALGPTVFGRGGAVPLHLSLDLGDAEPIQPANRPQQLNRRVCVKLLFPRKRQPEPAGS